MILNYCLLGDFDWLRILPALEKPGAISFPFLTRKLREGLTEAAKQLTYKSLPSFVSNGQVLQEIDSCNDFAEDNIFRIFAKEYEAFLLHKIQELNSYPFATNFEINDVSIQRYWRGTLGITAHVDGKSHRNLVSLLILEGEGRFYVCDNRQRDNASLIDTAPGNLLLMRANGFKQYLNTPFHFVTDIKSDRYVLGLRQKIKTA